MIKFIVKRLLLSILILFFVTLIVYALMYSLPTSYMEKTAREMAQKPGATKSAEQWLAELNAKYGMDQGVFKGYFTWLSSAIKGDFGDSWLWTVPVTQVFSERIWVSFSLNVVVLFFQLIIAIPLGVLAAKKQYSLTDYTVTVIALVGISMPSFFLATILKLIFGFYLGILPISGMQSRDYIMMSPTGQFFDLCKHLILPAVTLTVLGIGDLMRYTRTNTLEVLNADYIRTARAKGLSEKRVIGYHAFRNTLIPIITILGNSLPALFSGAMITEQLFAIRGIGYAGYNSMVQGDIPFAMFYLAFSAILTLAGNLLADILYAVADPRVRVN